METGSCLLAFPFLPFVPSSPFLPVFPAYLLQRSTARLQCPDLTLSSGSTFGAGGRLAKNEYNLKINNSDDHKNKASSWSLHFQGGVQ